MRAPAPPPAACALALAFARARAARARARVQARRLTRAHALVLALTLAAAGFACSPRRASSTQGDAGAPAVAGLTPEQAAQVLARVGDRTITLGDFAAALEHMDQFDRMRYQAPERRKELLREMIDVMLLADEARARGYDQDPETQQQVREILRDAYLQKARDGAPAPGDIPQDEVRAYYGAHKADFHDPERRRVSAIVLPTAAAAEAALAQAKKANAAQWGELVRARSIDPQARANVPVDLAGDLGFVDPPGEGRGVNVRVPAEVRAAVFQIPDVGGVLPSVVAAGGKFYVVRLAGRIDAHDRTLEEAERTIRVKLAQDKLHARQQALLDALRTQYPVTIDEAALAQVRVPPPGDAGTGAALRP
jgi:peptidyl-prolyl cis-trans isomerase C